MSYDDDRDEPRGALMALTPKRVTDEDVVNLSAEEMVLLQGNLAALTAQQRVTYYGKVCQSVGLNPLTKPFDYIVLDGKLTLYAKKDATDQLRSIHGISVERLEQEVINGIYVATAYGRDRTGRIDSDIGAVPVENLRSNNLANAMKKAVTQAKRRMTLSLAGLGWLDETEVDQVASATRVTVTETGEIEAPAETPKSLAAVVAARVSEAEIKAAPAADDRDATEAPGTEPEAVTVPEGGPPAPVAGEAAGEAPAASEAAQPAAPEPEAAVVADAGASGLTMEEFSRAAREKHALFGLIRQTAAKLWPEVTWTSKADIEALSDEGRLTLWLAVLADQP